MLNLCFPRDQITIFEMMELSLWYRQMQFSNPSIWFDQASLAEHTET